MNKRGWGELDVIIVTGDAYVDHPSYGASVIGRVLEGYGYKVGIIAQPDWRNLSDFKKLGRPRLFFGITAGNLDSMAANYTANKKIRNTDDYSPAGNPGLRPDRAIIIYANKIREAFGQAKIVIGGMEASMRRLAHYDYWSDTVKRSILLDSKADILVYGMGEKAIVEIANRVNAGHDLRAIDDVPGTVVARSSLERFKDYIEIPSFEEVKSEKNKFSESFRLIYQEFDPVNGHAIAQKYDNRYVIQLPQSTPLTSNELDRIYSLPFTRKTHPVYKTIGQIPGFDMVRNSITSHRGCLGGCSFCSLYLHQGRIISSRSIKSIINEIKEIASGKDFNGTITDIGGPTVNLYDASCEKWEKDGACRSRKCVTPVVCKNLKLGYKNIVKLWREARKIPNVKHVFIGSGIRYDLCLDPSANEFLNELCAHHVSGRLKVAPEHSSDAVLDIMSKPRIDIYEKFVQRFDEINKRLDKDQYLVNYFISAHPGARLEDSLNLALYLAKKHIYPEQIQDFIPLPMTISGAMYYTGINPITKRKLYVARSPRERKLHRALIQFKNPLNKRYIIEALQKLNRLDAAKILLN